MTIDLRQALADLENLESPSTFTYKPPEMPKPDTRPLAPEIREKYADFFDGLEEYLRQPVDQDLQEIAQASEKMRVYNKELAVIDDLRERRSHEAADEYKARTMNIIIVGKEARDRLKTLKVSEVFNVDESLADNMQKLCSYYNAKEDGPRFKTRRAPSNHQVLQIKRIR